MKYLTQYFLLHGHTHMHENETLYVAGGFDEPITDTAWYTRVEEGRGVKQPDPAGICNAEETDTRIWLHVKNTAYKRILVVSPDTDIYHIGLPLQQLCKEVVVQVSPINSQELKYRHMTALSKVLLNDPDLAHIEPRELLQLCMYAVVVTAHLFSTRLEKQPSCNIFSNMQTLLVVKTSKAKGYTC